MNATLLYRIASILVLLFALGHTVGFLKFKPPTAEGIAVRDAMANVHFQVRGHDYSYGSSRLLCSRPSAISFLPSGNRFQHGILLGLLDSFRD